MQRRIPGIVKRLVLGGGLLMGLSACASMSEAECVSADWRTIGFEDGAQGLGAIGVSRYRTACAGYGVVPDLDAYNDGRRVGLRDFCRPERGYRLGRSGNTYSGVCPPEMESAFLERYQDGQRVYQAASRVNQAERRLRDFERRIEVLHANEREAKQDLLEDGLTPLQRAQLLTEILDIVKEREAVLAQLEEARAAVDRLQGELEQVQRETDGSLLD